jgi:hypothetical protein
MDPHETRPLHFEYRKFIAHPLLLMLNWFVPTQQVGYIVSAVPWIIHDNRLKWFTTPEWSHFRKLTPLLITQVEAEALKWYHERSNLF